MSARLAGSGPMPNKSCDIEHCDDLVVAKVKSEQGAVTYTNYYCRTHARATGAFDGGDLQ